MGQDKQTLNLPKNKGCGNCGHKGRARGEDGRAHGSNKTTSENAPKVIKRFWLGEESWPIYMPSGFHQFQHREALTLTKYDGM